MRPCRRRPQRSPAPAARGGVVVAGRGLRGWSCVAVAVMLAIWWAATRETRTTTYRVLGDLAGIRLDLGDADVEIDGGGDGGRGAPRSTASPTARRPRSSRTVADGTLTHRSRCPDQVLGSCRASYRLTVPDNVPLEIQTSSGSVRVSGVRASVQVNTGSGAISATGLLRLPAARELGHGRRQRGQRVLAPTGSSCARAAATCARSSPPAATRSTRRATPARSASAGSPTPRRRAVPGPGAEHQRRRLRRGRLLTAALDLAPHLRAARRALLYLFVGLGQGLTYLLVIGGGLVLGVAARPAVDRPAAPGAAPPGSTWRLAEGERRQANRLLETHLPPVPRRRRAAAACASSSASSRVLARAGDAAAQAAGRARSGCWSRRAARSCWRSRSPASASAGSRATTAGSSDRGRSGPAVGIALCLLALPGHDRLDRRARGRRRGAARARAPAAALARRPRAAPCASCSPSGSATAR